MVKSKRFKCIKNSEGIDRMSSLPEPLLSRILSLLPTRYAVATSVLSTRWKFLWTSITNLKFDDNDYDDNDFELRDHKKDLNRRKKFTQFVNRVLLLLNPPCIQNFTLRCHHELCDPFYLNSWICAAMGRTTKKLKLHLSLVQSVELPLSHFHCKTIAVLKLSGDIHFKIAAAAPISFPNLLTLHLSAIEFTIANHCSVSFPSLKDLLLDNVSDTNKESVHKLFASCPVLDNLVIYRLDCHDPNCLIISIPSLRSLSIQVTFSDYTWPPDTNEYKLQIDTPALKYLDVEDESVSSFTAENLSSLLEAKIMAGFEYLSAIDANSYSGNVFKFIGSLVNTKFLSISGGTLEAISSISTNLSAPVFRNLTRLELSSHNCCDWSVLLENLLENMDNLEHLISTGYHSDDSKSWWIEPLRVPTCLLHKVTTISFTSVMCCCNDEFELIRYFLKNAKVLKKLTVNSIDGSDAKKLKLMHKILMCPRGSHDCQVDVGVGG